MWAAIASISIPLITAVLGLLQGRHMSGLSKRLKAHVELAESIKENPDARAFMDKLIAAEARELFEREVERLPKRLNWANLILTIILTVISGTAIYFFILWCMSWWGAPTAWIAVTASALVGMFLLLLTAAGYATLFNPPKTKEQRVAERAARKALRQTAAQPSP